MKIALIVLTMALAALLVGRSRRSGKIVPPARAPGEQEERTRTAADLWTSLATVERETGFFGRWHETRFEGHRIAFQQEGARMRIYGGDFDSAREQVVELYLGRLENRGTAPRVPSKQRLGRHVGSEGKELAATYHLLATDSGDLPLLRLEEIREGLLGFTHHVKEVGFYESGGVFVALELTRAMRGFDADMRQLVRLVNAYEKALSPSLA